MPSKLELTSDAEANLSAIGRIPVLSLITFLLTYEIGCLLGVSSSFKGSLSSSNLTTNSPFGPTFPSSTTFLTTNVSKELPLTVVPSAS